MPTWGPRERSIEKTTNITADILVRIHIPFQHHLAGILEEVTSFLEINMKVKVEVVAGTITEEEKKSEDQGIMIRGH